MLRQLGSISVYFESYLIMIRCQKLDCIEPKSRIVKNAYLIKDTKGIIIEFEKSSIQEEYNNKA